MDALCLDFLNSDWRDYHGGGVPEDRLGRPDWVAGFLARWGLPALPPPEPAVHARLAAFRDGLRGLLERASAGGTPDEQDLSALNQALGAAPLRRRVALTAAGPQLEAEPIARDWAWVQAAIAASCVELLAGRDPARIKFCENPDCGWAFYDESRPRSRRWCEDSCANLIKVRRYRQRHRTPSHDVAHPP